MKLSVKRAIFIAVICIGTVVAGVLRWPVQFQTDLTSLVNIESGSEWPLQEITDKFSSVVNVLVQSSNRLDGEIAVQKIRSLVTSDDFPEFNVLVADLSPRVFVNVAGTYHNAMVSANDRNLLQEHRFNEITGNVRRKIETSMMPNLLPLSVDPFLLFSNYVTGLVGGTANWVTQNGALWQYREPYNFYMLPISIEVTNNIELVGAVEKLKSIVENVKNENVVVYMGGVPVHTAEMYNRSKIEMSVISVLALIAVVVLNYLLFRRMATLIPIGLGLGIGYLAGTVSLILCFGTPHILVFVFGTSLIGLGIDYAFHFMCVTQQDDKKLVQRNILHSLITTVVCFAPLGFASIELLRQISVFTVVGLVSIYAFIKLFVSNNIPYNPKKVRAVWPIGTKYRLIVICCITIITIVVCGFARIENNMSAMYRPNGELGRAEKTIGDLNQVGKTAFLVVRGDNIQKVLETEEDLRDAGINFFGVSSVIPSLRRQAENNALVQELYKSSAKSIKAALELRSVPKFIPAPPMTLDNQNLGALRDQVSRFLVEQGGYIYSISTVPADTVVANENVRVIAPAAQIQTQMEKFSREAYRLLAICGVILMAGLLAIYRRRAWRYIMPPLLGVTVSVAVLTLFGKPITFFHLLGLFIIVGLGLDYAIFHINMRNNDELRPVFYSFLTSFIGFGMLAFTSFFLIAAMGLILAIGIAVSYVVSLYLFRN